MPARFQLLQSEATRNLVQNPSAETNITGWGAHGATVTQSTLEARFGRHSVRVVTNGVAIHEGVSVRSYPNTSGTNYAGSIYVRGRGHLRLRLRDNFNGDEFISPEFSPSTNRWIRIQDLIGRTGLAVSNDLRIYVETVSIQTVTFYVDGAQIEEGGYSTTYCDGEQDGCRWNIEKHGSVSDRLDNERSGGRFIDLVEEDSGLYITMAGGVGMPPLRHNLQGRALLPGLEFQSTKILPRTITLTFWTKHKDASPESLYLIHQARQRLIDIIKPDRVTPDQPFVLRYNNGPVPLDIECLYEAGLEFEGDIRNPYFNSFAVRFLITDPFWTEDNQHVATLDPIDMLAIQNGLIAKVNREWDDLGFVNNAILGGAIGPDGNLYVTGRFTMIGGVGANGIAGYDGTNWFPLGTGLNMLVAPQPTPNGIVIVFGPDGSLYVCGNFNDAGGVANTQCLARWDFNTNLWNTVGGGLNNPAYSMSFAPNGSLFITGMFTIVDPAGAPIIANNIVEWTGTTWNPLIDAVTLVNGLVPAGAGGAGLEIVVGGSGTVYVGGAFTSAANVANTDSIARWHPPTLVFSSMGGSADNDIRAIAVDKSENVYIGGFFTTIGGVALNRAAVWNGTAWSQLAGGLSGDTRWIFVDADGLVWFVGDFAQALDVAGVTIPNTRHVVIWDDSQWVPAQFTVPANLTRMRTIVISGEDMYFGGEGALGNAFISSPNIVNSLATADSFPIFHFERIGGTNVILIMILNETSRRQMKFTYEMSDGEEVEIDLRLGIKSIRSSLFNVNIDVADALKNRLGELLPGSDFANWALVPGLNTISIYVQPIGDPTIEASMRWIPLHWSADAVGS